MLNFFKNRRRKRVLQTPWPAAWEMVLEENVGHYQSLSAAEQEKLKSTAKILVSEKHWEAHDGLTMTDEIKVTIAASAALLLLGVSNFYFEQVKTIIVFPHPIRRKSSDGFLVGRESRHAGEAWQSGQVVLSWNDVVSDAKDPTDGRNLVIHEFAHCLDGLDGEMGGSLAFDDEATNQQWKRVSEAEFENLTVAVQQRRRTLLDYYGATNLAEFFAVSSETFFEQPRQLKKAHPELFELLLKYYQVDPLNWA